MAEVFNASNAYELCVGGTKPITTEEKLEAILKLVAERKPRYVWLGRPAKATDHVATLRIYPTGKETTARKKAMV